jgi:hypothetical protein
MFDEELSSGQQRTISQQQSEIISLEKETAEALSEAGMAIERASELDIKSAALNKEAEELKAKNLALEAQIAPRRMDQQCKDFPPSVKYFSGEVVRVDTYILDIDGGILGAQIVGCLNSLGIKADNEISSIVPTGWFGVGVFVSGKNETLVSAIKEALVRAKVKVVDGTGIFEGNQVTTHPWVVPNPAATVVVGIKPPIDMK